ncbi:MAG: MBL fold metallo-hydrolase [Gammaproteobacteria bacterium]
MDPGTSDSVGRIVTLRFCSLGSGSRGNALLIEFRNTLLMVDCGLSVKAITERMASRGRHPSEVTALLVTHEHTDHVQGVARLARRFGTQVWMTCGTAAALGANGMPTLQTFSSYKQLEFGEIGVEPYPVPHDAREPCQYVFTAGDLRLGVITDTGHVTPHVLACLAHCDALGVECNHDLEALWQGGYPEAVKKRVASQLGHLSNEQAAELLASVEHDGLQWAMALHLSQQNNSPDYVFESMQGLLGGPNQKLHIASQDVPSPWLEIV